MPLIGAVISQVQDAHRLKATALRLLGAGQTAEAQPLLRQYLEFKLLQTIDTIHVPSLVGNWVAHYETNSGTSVSAFVLSSIITIDGFAECFRYDDTSSGMTVRRWYRSLDSR